MGKGTWQLSLLQGVVFIFLFSGFYLPLLSFFFGKNPFEPGEYLLDRDYLLEFLSDSWNLQVIWFSFYQAFLERHSCRTFWHSGSLDLEPL